MTTRTDWEITQLVRSGIYADQDAVLRSALNALFLLHPDQKLQMVISTYRAGEISLGKAAELMGVSSEEMKDLLRQAGVEIHLGPESVTDLEAEIQVFEST